MDVNPAADRKRMLRGFAILVAVYLVVVYAIPKPLAVKPEGWRLTGIFAGLIVYRLGPVRLMIAGSSLGALRAHFRVVRAFTP